MPSAPRLLGIKGDVAFAVGIVGILIVMVIPLPTVVLDVLLSFSITLSLLILLVAVYCLKPLEFSVFPSLLLVTTLFRLSLNVASTRLILLHGNEGEGAAGQVINTFGRFMVGGNYVVGIVIFLILVTINFIVITKGAGRIAEVAARFVLDAMPGKQMSIDADLNAGLIDDVEARRRRKEISSEADFYGAMDGASKFVRGDAIAGIIITLINIVGGLIIGTLQHGLSVSEAAQNYTVLTVGDGLVSQIPALIISTSAGIIVSRAAAESDLGGDMVRQITDHPKAIALTAAILFILGLMPGLPHLSFLTLCGLTGGVAYVAMRAEKTRMQVRVEQERKKAVPKGPEKVESLLPLDIMELEVGYGLIPLVNVEQSGDLLDRIKSIRRQFASDMGIVIPPLHIRDNLQLKQGEYSIILKGIRIAGGELMMGHMLAMDPGTVTKRVEGVPTTEPTFGLPALWIREGDRDKAQMAGYTVVDHATIIATHLTEVIRSNSPLLLTRQETQNLLDNLAKTQPRVVEELVPNILPLGGVQKVLQNLLKEGVPVRDLLTIVETLADYAPLTKDYEILTEYVRQALARTITNQYLSGDKKLYLMTLNPKLEEAIAEAVHTTDQGSYLAVEPEMAQRLIKGLNKAMEKFAPTGSQPVILTSPGIRSHLKRLTERFIPKLVVLSHNEIAPDVKVNSLGAVSV